MLSALPRSLRSRNTVYCTLFFCLIPSGFLAWRFPLTQFKKKIEMVSRERRSGIKSTPVYDCGRFSIPSSKGGRGGRRRRRVERVLSFLYLFMPASHFRPSTERGVGEIDGGRSQKWIDKRIPIYLCLPSPPRSFLCGAALCVHKWVIRNILVQDMYYYLHYTCNVPVTYTMDFYSTKDCIKFAWFLESEFCSGKLSLGIFYFWQNLL